MSKAEVIRFLRNYKNNMLHTPDYCLRKSKFIYDVYSNWAIDELITEIRKSDIDSISTIERFLKKMSDYACINVNNIQFSIAEDVTEHVYELIDLERR